MPASRPGAKVTERVGDARSMLSISADIGEFGRGGGGSSVKVDMYRRVPTDAEKLLGKIVTGGEVD